MAANTLPDDGTLVTAMTYESVEYDLEARAVTGELSTRPAPLGYTQCYVDGAAVQPETVRAVEKVGGNPPESAPSP